MNNEKIKILFLCHGNICRSPLAEYIMNDKIKKAELAGFVHASSAALHTDELGNGVYPPAKKLLNAAGINCDSHRARLATKSEYDSFDYIICMDEANVRDAKKLFGGDPDKKFFKLLEFLNLSETADRDVADPWYTRDFEKSWMQIEAGCKALLYKIAQDLFPHSDEPVSNETMREADAYTIKNFVSSEELMRRAGEAIFENIKDKITAPVAIVCGKGNNAGDGLVTALCLSRARIPCKVILISETLSDDSLYYLDWCVNAGVPIAPYVSGASFDGFGTIIDCIFGTGFSGEPREPYASAIRSINDSNAFIISADINSGINGGTGLGDLFVKSDLTISIGSYKKGHFIGNAPLAIKEIVNVDIGIVVKN